APGRHTLKLTLTPFFLFIAAGAGTGLSLRVFWHLGVFTCRQQQRSLKLDLSRQD
ncbi:hypothetical protein BDZ89DRAFT_1060520, partial [Hymenopellis radicata]